MRVFRTQKIEYIKQKHSIFFQKIELGSQSSKLGSLKKVKK
jgi:hypothetical protein